MLALAARKRIGLRRGRFGFEGRIRYIHLPSVKHNEWLQQADVTLRSLVRSCCNPQHIQKGTKSVRHLSKRRADNLMRQRSHLRLFHRTAQSELSRLEKSWPNC